MNITEIVKEDVDKEHHVLPFSSIKPHQYTDDELQREYDFVLVERLAAALLSAGVITDKDRKNLSRKNRAIYAPFLVELMP